MILWKLKLEVSIVICDGKIHNWRCMHPYFHIHLQKMNIIFCNRTKLQQYIGACGLLEVVWILRVDKCCIYIALLCHVNCIYALTSKPHIALEINTHQAKSRPGLSVRDAGNFCCSNGIKIKLVLLLFWYLNFPWLLWNRSIMQGRDKLKVWKENMKVIHVIVHTRLTIYYVCSVWCWYVNKEGVLPAVHITSRR